MEPLLVEVIAYAPTAFYHCTHCEFVWDRVGVGQKIHEDQMASAMPKELTEEYAALSDWVRGVFDRYGTSLVVKVIDAASIEGFWKSLRYGMRKYPAFIVGGKDKYSGSDFARVEQLIDQRFQVAQGA